MENIIQFQTRFLSELEVKELNDNLAKKAETQTFSLSFQERIMVWTPETRIGDVFLRLVHFTATRVSISSDS